MPRRDKWRREIPKAGFFPAAVFHHKGFGALRRREVWRPDEGHIGHTWAFLQDGGILDLSATAGCRLDVSYKTEGVHQAWLIFHGRPGVPLNLREPPEWLKARSWRSGMAGMPQETKRVYPLLALVRDIPDVGDELPALLILKRMERMNHNGEFRIPGEAWDGYVQYEIYRLPSAEAVRKAVMPGPPKTRASDAGIVGGQIVAVG